jgi:squalene-hopene/tetraprenyl-beta-curcumene cyclase
MTPRGIAAAEKLSGAETHEKPASFPPEPERDGGIRRDDGLRAERDRIQAAIVAAGRWLVRAQEPEGCWTGELEADVTLNAEYLMFLHFMGLERRDGRRKLLEHIRRRQLPDGSWNIYHGGPGNISASVEAYFAFKINGFTGQEPFLVKAREWVLAHGGVMGTRFLTKIYLTYFGQFPWSGIPSLPIHVMLLPKISPVNIYKFACWARTYTVPLLILNVLKPCVPAPEGGSIDELYTVPRNRLQPKDYRFAADKKNLISWTNIFRGIDGVMKIEEKMPFNFHRKPAIKLAEQWILNHQDETGDWGGIFPAMMNSLMALKALGYRLDHPVMVKGLEAFDRLQVEEDEVIRHQPCVGPVWDTVWAAMAMAGMRDALDGRAGAQDMDAFEKARKRSIEWLLSRQIRRKGDWAVHNRKAKPAAWCFQFNNDFYPDIDDTAVVLMDLMDDPDIHHDANMRAAMESGRDWLLSMQNPDGGFASFEKNVDQNFWNEIPYNDCKNMLDPSTDDLTARVLGAIGAMGLGKDCKAARRGVKFLKRSQGKDGAWFGRWGVNYIYGTWSVLNGLHRLGHDMSENWLQRAADWLENRQNGDGGWGETCGSYDADGAHGEGESTASQTAWAIWGLACAGRVESEAVARGVKYLLDRQSASGTWDEAPWTGTGFPGAFYLKYHMYPKYFPILALSAVAQAIK